MIPDLADKFLAITRKRAAEDTMHTYTQVPDFEPHGWVLLAMIDAYKLGQTDPAKPA